MPTPAPIDRIAAILFPGGDLDHEHGADHLAAVADVVRAYLAQPARWFVVYTRIPTNYNPDQTLTVEAATAEDARQVARHHLRDLGGVATYDYKVRPYTAPPAGRVV